MVIDGLEEAALQVEACLSAVLHARRRPVRLVEAMRHAVFAGGKRLRPYLVIESTRLLGGNLDQAIRVGAALEAVHCYSLVHDDLPAMDDDALRRGQPTVHVAFDEATAVLAGDALLTLAFALIAEPATSPRARVRTRLIGALAEAAGLDGMVGGQMLDLAAEGRFSRSGRPLRLSLAQIRQLQGKKTGALIRFGVEAGALLSERVSRSERQALRRYGDRLGFAFQIRDDLLDIEGEAGIVGKALAKDQHAGKATLIAHFGVEGARAELLRVTDEAIADLRLHFGVRAERLAQVLVFNRNRAK